MEDGTTFGKSTEHSLEIMFEDSLKSGNDSVLAIVCYPLQSDREDAENRWGKPFKDVMKLTPVERYGLLKKYIIDQGVNLEKTHITFFSPDTFKGVTPSRTEAYMPKKFVYFSEELDKPAIINKNEKFGNHPNCIETRITNR